jgi:hypothetical protein
MTRTASALTLALALSVGGAAFAEKHSSAKHRAKRGWGATTVTCPIMKTRVARAKATAVKTKSGKTVWVCCKSCVASAKKLR